MLLRVKRRCGAPAHTPEREAIRVRTIGVLGWGGRRASISSADNATLGRFLLALLPRVEVYSSRILRFDMEDRVEHQIWTSIARQRKVVP